MHRGPHAWSWAWSKSKVDPQQKSGTCARKRGEAEASTLLHESSNSEPETIKQGEIVFHYIRVRVARVGVIPLVGTKPVTINREHTHTHIFLLQLHKDTRVYTERDQEWSSYLGRQRKEHKG